MIIYENIVLWLFNEVKPKYNFTITEKIVVKSNIGREYIFMKVDAAMRWGGG